MTKFLWTGESKFCICGHHLTDHETSQSLISLNEPPIVICRGSRGDKSNIIRNCHCDEFRSYRRIAEEEDRVVGAIEKQNFE